MPKSTLVQDVVLPELDVTNEDWLASAKEAGSMLRNNEDRAAIAFYKRHLKLALTQLAELRAVSEWVSVDDRLPDVTNGMFLVTYLFQDKYPCQKVCAWITGYFRDLDLVALKNVTHWKPLGALPQPSPASAVSEE